MNAKIHPAIAALVLAMTFVSIGLWMWASGVAASLGGPAGLNTSPDGHHFIRIQNQLVEHDADGAYLATHDLEAMGVEVFLGGYAFFSNGDILLRRGPDPRSFASSLRAYKREANLSSIVPDDADSGLFRCKLETQACERFGEGMDFRASIGIYIDWETDEVYISDTTRHLLRKYSPEGVELTEPVGGFEFPNQLLLHDDQLYVADTNHRAIRRLDTQTSAFGESIERMDVTPDEAEIARQTWPAHFARVGDSWWVNNMQTNMNFGGLYVFDDRWRYLRRIELPPDADPISILPVGDTVWVSDWNNDVVRRFTTAGEPLPDLESAGLEQILTTSRLERTKYTILSFAGVAVVAVMFLALIIRAITDSTGKGSTRHREETDSDALDADTGPLHLEPDEKVRKRMIRGVRLAVLLMLLTFPPLIYIFGELDKPEFVIGLIGPLAIMAVLIASIAWASRAYWGTSISVDGDTVTLKDHTGRQSSCPIRHVRYDDTAIATHDTLVILGQPNNARIYDRDSVEEHLLPRLAKGQRVGPFEMLKLQIQFRHPQGILLLMVLIGVVVYGVLQVAQ